MLKRRILVVFLAVLLAGAFVGLAEEKSDKDIGYEMIDLWKGAQTTMEKYGNDQIGYGELVSDFQDYAGKARFIYKDAFENSENKEFVKLAAMTTMVMDLYAEGFEETDLDKVKLATKIGESVLLPHVKDMKYEE